MGVKISDLDPTLYPNLTMVIAAMTADGVATYKLTIQQVADLANAILLDGAGGAYDTLKELQDEIIANDGDITSILSSIADNSAALAQRLRVDAAQGLTATQQETALDNLGIRGALSGFKNRFMNPLFFIDEEGNSGGTTANNKHIVEGWNFKRSTGVTTLTALRTAGQDVPYALRVVVTTGSDASMDAGDHATFQTAIEGYDVADLYWGTADAKNAWICGSIQAPTTGKYCVAVQNADATRSYVFEVDCIADTPVSFEKEIPGDTSGTWNTENGIGVMVFVTMMAGSTYQAPSADTWNTGDYRGTANQSNAFASNGNVFKFENPRFSVGGPIPTEWRPFSADLKHCQRYYEIGQSRIYAVGTGATGLGYTTPFKVKKRNNPSVSATATLGTLGTTSNSLKDGIYNSWTSFTSGNGAADWVADSRLI